MDFRTRKNRERFHNRIQNEDWETTYPHNVMLYYIPPTEDISLQLFEELAIERLNVLRILEQATVQNLRILSDEWKNKIIAELNQAGLKHYVRLIDGRGDAIARRRDYISHFVLRLAYCRTQDLKKWFLQREMELFKLKFRWLAPNEIQRFLDIWNLDYSPISEEEAIENKEGICDSLSGAAISLFSSMEFYKVHFTEVPDLVAKRRCFIRGGFAYICTQDLISIVAGRQETCITNGLESASETIPRLEADDRLAHFLKNLNTSYTGKDYSLNSKQLVPIECIDQLSIKSFPLCMRQCHESLRTHHHLKHNGRMQYGLFLKGIGVTLEDALRFWREEFTRIMDMDKFERSYSYNIRYNYGKEGSQRNWAPFSCLKIISLPGGVSDVCGCPFKNNDSTSLKSKLATYGISTVHQQEITSLAAKGHYQLACGKYFDAVHDIKLEDGISHPNQFFDKSQSVMENRMLDGKPNSKTIKTSSDNASQKESIQRKTKQSILDEYDDDLWHATQQAELVEISRQDTQTWDNDEEDFSQMEDIY